jgi:RNA ligase
MVESANDFNIPVVDSYIPINDIISFSDNVRYEQGIEGYVIRFHDGHMLKIKTDEYVAIHRAKESILWDRNIVELIIENKLDDIKSHLTRDEQDRLNIFENNIIKYIKEKEIEILNIGYDCSKSMSRKGFALNVAPKLDGLTKACVFSIYDWPIMYEVRKIVKKSILNNLTKNTNYDELCKLWFNNERYN